MFRAARGLIDCGVSQLAKELQISRKTVSEIEGEITSRPDSRRTQIVLAMRDYFESRRGLVFLFDQDGIGEGVRYARAVREPYAPGENKISNSAPPNEA
jgi:DNA-binding XRE family transcriptional regulator